MVFLFSLKQMCCSFDHNSHVLLFSPLSESQNASNTSPVCKSSHHTESPAPSSQWPACLPPFVLVLQGLCASLLSLINSLVMLLIGPQCLHSSGPCSLLVYLDPGLSLLAVITLIATAMPQVRIRPRSNEEFNPLITRNLERISPRRQMIHSWRSFVLQLYPNLLTVVSPGAQVRTAAAAGHASTHLCVWSRAEDCERPRGAGRARPPRLAVNRIFHGGLCPRALPCWLSSAQVRWTSLTLVLRLFIPWPLRALYHV